MPTGNGDVHNETLVTDPKAELEKLFKLQEELIDRVQRGLVSLAKDGKRKSSKYYYTSWLKKMEELTPDFEDNHREIIDSLPK